MVEIFSSSLSIEQVLALINSASPSTFVGNSAQTPISVANLLSNFPAGPSYLGMYARVFDLFGAVDDIMRCRFDGVNYRWVPQRPNFVGTSAATSGTITITPLLTAPTLRLTGNLLGNMTINPVSTNAFIGMQQKIVQEGILGLFTSTITGLIGSNLTLLGNTTKTIEYGPTGWFQSS